MKKRIISTFLCLLMVFSLIPATKLTAYAAHTCPECGDLIDGDDYCKECYKCESCAGQVCPDCEKCSDCVGSSNCPECGICQECGSDHCLTCLRCDNCCEICSNCSEICIDCHREEGTEGICPGCGKCHEGVNYCLYCGSCDDCCEICDRCDEVCLDCHELLAIEDPSDDAFVCPECGRCKQDGTHYCMECGICADCATICESCFMCEDCGNDNGVHCPECGNCYEEAGRCESEYDHCAECCTICDGCGDCFTEDMDSFCEHCGMCDSCTVTYDTHCSECGNCYVEVERCPDGGDHCVDCCEYCPDCDKCVTASGEDLCEYCGLCEECCRANAEDMGCTCGEYCVENDADWSEHICVNCNACFCQVERCETCEEPVCIECCQKIAREKGCDCEPPFCSGCSDWEEHYIEFHHDFGDKAKRVDIKGLDFEFGRYSDYYTISKNVTAFIDGKSVEIASFGFQKANSETNIFENFSGRITDGIYNVGVILKDFDDSHFDPYTECYFDGVPGSIRKLSNGTYFFSIRRDVVDPANIINSIEVFGLELSADAGCLVEREYIPDRMKVFINGKRVEGKIADIKIRQRNNYNWIISSGRLQPGTEYSVAIYFNDIRRSYLADNVRVQVDGRPVGYMSSSNSADFNVLIICKTPSEKRTGLGVWVNGNQFYDGESNTILCSKGTATLNTATTPWMLTLQNAEINNAAIDCSPYDLIMGGILSKVPLNIVLVGNNTINVDKQSYVNEGSEYPAGNAFCGCVATLGESDISFGGTGTLTLNGGSYSIFLEDGDFSLSNAAVICRSTWGNNGNGSCFTYHSGTFDTLSDAPDGELYDLPGEIKIASDAKNYTMFYAEADKQHSGFIWTPCTYAEYAGYYDTHDETHPVGVRITDSAPVYTFTATPLNDHNAKKLSLTASGGASYKFYYECGGNWVRLQDWSGLDHCEMTGYENSGYYNIYCDIRAYDGTVVTRKLQFKYENISMTVTPETCKVGETVSIMASGAVRYGYYYHIDSEKIYETIKAFSSFTGPVTFTPDRPGKYRVECGFEDADGNIKYISKYVTVTSTGPEFTVLPEKTCETGKAVTMTATGGSAYKFYYECAGSWVRLQDFSEKNACTWTPSKSGNYNLYCDIKDASGNVTAKKIAYKVTGTEPLKVSLSFQYASPQTAGTTIKITANATGGKGALKYKFYSECNGVWTKLWDYDTRASYNWHATTIGTHTLYCDVMDEAGTVVCAVVNYQIVNGTEFVADLNANRISGQLTGTEIRLLGGSSNGVGEVQYKFYYEVNGNWVKLQDFSTQDYCLWTPAKAGYYNLYMDAKDSAGHTASKRLCITIDEGQTLKVTNVTANPAQGTVGTNTTFTAVSTGGSGTVTYKFYYEMNGAWVKLQDFSTAKTCSWKPTKAGTYHIYVDAIDGTKNTQCLMINYVVK